MTDALKINGLMPQLFRPIGNAITELDQSIQKLNEDFSYGRFGTEENLNEDEKKQLALELNREFGTQLAQTSISQEAPIEIKEKTAEEIAEEEALEEELAEWDRCDYGEKPRWY